MRTCGWPRAGSPSRPDGARSSAGGGSAARDGERALHPELVVAVELAHERVVAGCQGHGRVLGEAGDDRLDLVDDLVTLQDLELVLLAAALLDRERDGN